MESEKVKEFVKKRYGEIAQTEQSCCCSSSCCGPSMKDVALQIGYSERDIENIPDDSVLGLGLGLNFNLFSSSSSSTTILRPSRGNLRFPQTPSLLWLYSLFRIRKQHETLINEEALRFITFLSFSSLMAVNQPHKDCKETNHKGAEHYNQAQLNL